MLNVETEREEDGRWIAEVPALPGVMVCGATREEALAKTKTKDARGGAETRSNLLFSALSAAPRDQLVDARPKGLA